MDRAMSRSDIRPQFRGRNRGFSYIWLLLFIAFMGYGLTVVAEIQSTVSQREKERALLAIGRQFREAIRRYHETQATGTKKEYPASLDDLLKDPRYPGIKRHLRQIFVDPITGQPKWGLVKVGERIVGVHSLSGLTPIKQDNFELEDMQFRGKQKYAEWVFVYPSDLLLQIDASGTPSIKSSVKGAENEPMLKNEEIKR
jgi:type II secretory pathway pseudopilin PulG